jgi:membrane-bound lytic murein transglycosylase B
MVVMRKMLWANRLGMVVAAALAVVAPVMAEEAPVAAPAPSQDAAPIKDFATFVQELRTEALDKGIRAETLDGALGGIQHIDRVIELDRKQPEFTLSFDEYLGRVVNPTKVAKGRKLLAENRQLLAEIEKRYGVQPRFVVALWGIESGYGQSTGSYNVVSSLATLAYDGRRSKYFRGEVLDALKIIDGGNIAADKMIGSWAGAMGQCQFMPSAFLKFAEDWDGDGRRDIWTTRADVLASAANYLSKTGWNGDQTWGRAVQVPANFDAKLYGLDTKKSMKEWAKLGVRSSDGKALPKRDLQASLVQAEAGKGPPFMVYDNFRTIMKWNRSTFFALAAGHLADRIGGR